MKDEEKIHRTRVLRIGDRSIGPGNPVFIIAEIGINHRGNLNECIKLVRAAAKAGADAVKLQTINADDSYVAGTVSHLEFSEKELSLDELRELVALAKELNVILFTTPGDFSSLEKMVMAGIKAAKVSSGLMTNTPLISKIGKNRLPIIISTGMAYEDEIAVASKIALDSGSPGVGILKCTSIYPSPDDTLNLNAISSMLRRFPFPIGYSDHTLDELACVSAVSLGATIIEKHFTLDKTLVGEDHAISMEPDEFASMVASIRRVEAMLGEGEIGPASEEIAYREQRHRCLIARRAIRKGEQFTEQNVGLKRPAPGKLGMSPSLFSDLIGRRASMKLDVDTPITSEHIV